MRWFTRRAGDDPRVTVRGTLSSPDGFDVLVALGVSDAGPVGLWSSAEGAALLRGRQEHGPDGARFPRTRPVDRPDVALTVHDGAGAAVTVTVVRGLPVSFPLVALLSDGSFLVVGARCTWRPDGPELNALVVDADGEVVHRGCLGDGIQHLQVGADGTVWAGYFDEGVFGNLGWGGPGPTPLGAGGVVAWSPELEKVWELDPVEGLVSDCYALNAGGEDVLACPYTDFPVLRISDRRPRVFATTGVSGPSGILGLGDEVALLGAYGDPTLLVRGTSAGGAFREVGRGHLRAPDGKELRFDRLVCRGSVAHVFSGVEWCAYDLAGDG